ncbi:MAG: hypothetical protein AB7O68_08210 [Pirellulales bacterium]
MILKALVARDHTKLFSQMSAVDKSRVELRGGDYGAGLIRGYAVATIGVVSGRDLWIDAVFLGQLSEAINGSTEGKPMRASHPEGEADALAGYVATTKAARIDGEVLRADAHFVPMPESDERPDLASSILLRANFNPRSMGCSIYSTRDLTAERKFVEQHGKAAFRSPDARNVSNLPHIRLAELVAVDFCEIPAANRDGLFARPPIDRRLAINLGSENMARFASSIKLPK